MKFAFRHHPEVRVKSGEARMGGSEEADVLTENRTAASVSLDIKNYYCLLLNIILAVLIFFIPSLLLPSSALAAGF